MNLPLLAGALLILLGGILQGTFAVPMKYARGWRHENIWLVFAFSGLVALPWILTFATVPSLGGIYRSAPSGSLWAIVLFGLCWGIGATLTGVGLKLMGISLGLAVILGLSASLGSLVPLVVLAPEKLASRQGACYIAGTLVMFLGIALVAVAGSIREKRQAAGAGSGERSFAAGLAVCIAAGLLSSALNFSYTFGAAAIERARELHASALWAPNVVAAPATTGGFLANLVYCAVMLRRNRSASLFRAPGAARNWLLGFLMGLFWFGGLAVYGIGAFRMGPFGAILGWPLLMGAIVISSNIAGVFTGEWKGAGTRAGGYLALGSATILAALAVLALAQRAAE